MFWTAIHPNLIDIPLTEILFMKVQWIVQFWFRSRGGCRLRKHFGKGLLEGRRAVGGRRPPMWVLFSENICENEIIGSCWRARAGGAPLEPPMLRKPEIWPTSRIKFYGIVFSRNCTSQHQIISPPTRLSLGIDHRPNYQLLSQFWSATFLQKSLDITNLFGKYYATECRFWHLMHSWSATFGFGRCFRKITRSYHKYMLKSVII